LRSGHKGLYWLRQGPTVRPFEGPTVRPFEGPTVRPFEGPTVRPFEGPTVLWVEGPSVRGPGVPLDGSSVHRRKSCDRRLTSNIPLLLFIIPDFRENIGLFFELFLIGIFWRQSGRIAIIEDGHCYTYEKKKHADIEGV